MFDRADEVDDSCPTRPKTAELISAAVVDQRGRS
jgi:hypothetical protein